MRRKSQAAGRFSVVLGKSAAAVARARQKVVALYSSNGRFLAFEKKSPVVPDGRVPNKKLGRRGELILSGSQ